MTAAAAAVIANSNSIARDVFTTHPLAPKIARQAALGKRTSLGRGSAVILHSYFLAFSTGAGIAGAAGASTRLAAACSTDWMSMPKAEPRPSSVL